MTAGLLFKNLLGAITGKWYFAILPIDKIFFNICPDWLNIPVLKALRQNCAAARVAVGQGQSFSKLPPVFDMYLSQIAKCICLKLLNVFVSNQMCGSSSGCGTRPEFLPAAHSRLAAVWQGGVKVWHEILLGLIPTPVHRPQLRARPKLRMRKVATLTAAYDQSPVWPRGGGRWYWIVIIAIICIFELIMISRV